MKSLLLSYSSSLSLYFPNAVKQTSSKWGSKRFFILSRSIKNKSIVDINTSSLFENKNILIMFWKFYIPWWITLRIESIIFTLLCGLKTIMTFTHNEGTKRDNKNIFDLLLLQWNIKYFMAKHFQTINRLNSCVEYDQFCVKYQRYMDGIFICYFYFIVIATCCWSWHEY